MRIVYVAGPYRAKTHYEVELNVRQAEAASIELWQMGYAVICPHKNTAHFDNLAPDEIWLEGDLEIIKRLQAHTDIMVMLPGWENSEGALKEKEIAEFRHFDIFYWPQDKEKLARLA